jgi:hypothetical protein
MKNSMILWAVSGCAALGLAVACSSSSTPATTPATDAGPTEDTGPSSSSGGTSSSGGSSSGGGMDSAASAMCLNSTSCPTGQVCCATIMSTTSCQVGPCPSTPVGPLQLCSTSAECTSPQVCLTLAVMPAVKTCQMGDGGTTTSEAGSEAGAGEAGSPEAGGTDASPDAADGG